MASPPEAGECGEGIHRRRAMSSPPEAGEGGEGLPRRPTMETGEGTDGLPRRPAMASPPEAGEGGEGLSRRRTVASAAGHAPLQGRARATAIALGGRPWPLQGDPSAAGDMASPTKMSEDTKAQPLLQPDSSLQPISGLRLHTVVADHPKQEEARLRKASQEVTQQRPSEITMSISSMCRTSSGRLLPTTTTTTTSSSLCRTRSGYLLPTGAEVLLDPEQDETTLPQAAPQLSAHVADPNCRAQAAPPLSVHHSEDKPEVMESETKPEVMESETKPEVMEVKPETESLTFIRSGITMKGKKAKLAIPPMVSSFPLTSTVFTLLIFQALLPLLKLRSVPTDDIVAVVWRISSVMCTQIFLLMLTIRTTASTFHIFSGAYVGIFLALVVANHIGELPGMSVAYISAAWATGVFGYTYGEYVQYIGAEKAAERAAYVEIALIQNDQSKKRLRMYTIIHCIFTASLVIFILAARLVWVVFVPSYDDTHFLLLEISILTWWIIYFCLLIISALLLHGFFLRNECLLPIMAFHLGSYPVSLLFLSSEPNDLGVFFCNTNDACCYFSGLCHISIFSLCEVGSRRWITTNVRTPLVSKKSEIAAQEAPAMAEKSLEDAGKGEVTDYDVDAPDMARKCIAVDAPAMDGKSVEDAPGYDVDAPESTAAHGVDAPVVERDVPASMCGKTVEEAPAGKSEISVDTEAVFSSREF